MPSTNIWLAVGVFSLVIGVGGLLYAYGVVLHPVQVTVVAGVVILAILAVILFKVFGFKGIGKLFSSGAVASDRDMDRAEEVARGFWRRKRNEEFDYNESHGIERVFGSETVYGFCFHRVVRGTEKAGFPVVIVVRRDPFRVVRWEDHPTIEEQRNPFRIWSAGYIGTPVKGLTPSMDAAYFKGQFAEKPPSTSINIGSDDFFRRKNEEKE